MRGFVLVMLLLLGTTSWALAEKGHLPPPPEENYNSMVLDYIVTGAVFDRKTYSDDWTRSYTYEGKLDPSFGGVLRVTGQAQWLTYPGPDSPYQWNVTVTVTAGSKKQSVTYLPKSKSQSFDLSVPIGEAQEGSFQIQMWRDSTGGQRNMKASGTMRGRVVLGPGHPTSTSVTGAALSEQTARDLMGREMANPAQIARNQVLYTGNDGGVANGGRPPRFTLNAPTTISFLMSYHYNNGQGAPPGTLGLRRSDGKMFGPWQATGINKVYWVVSPEVTLPPGTYEVVDSDPATWSQNGPGAEGHVLIKGRR